MHPYPHNSHYQSLLIHIVQGNIAEVVIVCSFNTYITIHKYRSKCDFRLLKNLMGGCKKFVRNGSSSTCLSGVNVLFTNMCMVQVIFIV